MHRFHHYPEYPIDLKAADEELPPMSFELEEPSCSSDSELRFVHPLTSAER